MVAVLPSPEAPEALVILEEEEVVGGLPPMLVLAEQEGMEDSGEEGVGEATAITFLSIRRPEQEALEDLEEGVGEAVDWEQQGVGMVGRVAMAEEAEGA